MLKKEKKKHSWNLWITAAIVYIFCLGVTVLIMNWVETAESYNPFHIFFRDFDITDIYYHSGHSDHAKRTDADIVVINAGCASRGDIARAVGVIQSYGPKVIGIDYAFSVKSRTRADTLNALSLDSAIRNSDNIVVGYAYQLARGRWRSSEVLPKSNRSRSTFAFGFLNLSDSVSTIRTVNLKVPYGKDTLYSFALAVVETSGLEYPLLNEPAKLDEPFRIRYIPETGFTVKDLTDLRSSDSALCKILHKKIVLIGDTGSRTTDCALEPRHFTPMNPELAGRSYPDMEGVFIHANIIHSLLNKSGKSAFYEIPEKGVRVLTLLLCMPLLVLAMIVYCRPHHIFHFFMVLLYEPIVTLSFTLIAVMLYRSRLYIPTGYAFTVLTLSPFVIYIIDLLDMWLNRLIKHWGGTGTHSFFSIHRIDHFSHHDKKRKI